MASIVAFSGCTAGVALSAGSKEASYSCSQRVLAGPKAHDSAWLQSGTVSSVGFQGVQLSSEPRRVGRKLRQTKKQAARCVAAAGSAPLKVIISGAPASGKGTQCEGIVKQYGLTHISAGDLLRAEVANKTEWGLKAKEYMDAGMLVPDEVVITMVKQRLQQKDAQEKGWLLDGYPRSASQAAALEAAGIRPDIFILLEVPDEILVERVAGRRLDPVTGRIYHLKFSPPETEEVAARLTLRSDDTEDKVKTRLATHNANVESVLSTYKTVTKEVNGNRNKDVVFADINKLLQHALGELRQSTNGTAASSSKAAEKEGWRGVPTRLNQIPHSREIREYFYQDACAAVQRAVAAGHRKLEVKVYIPELNPEMDVYRIGTLMEFLREMTFAFANSGKRVKACVQGSMGAGVFSGMPLSLAGSRRIMEAMDWGEDGETSARIRFGAVGPNEVWEDDEAFVIMSPQNTVANCILDDLEPMVEKAKDKIVVIINPKLGDVPSASGVMQIQGREKRMAFSDSFFTCYNFRLLYKSTSFYPIIGALRMAYPGPYELWKRIDTGDQEEEYIQLEGQWDEEPKGAVLGGAFAYRPPPKVEAPRQKLFGLF